MLDVKFDKEKSVLSLIATGTITNEEYLNQLMPAIDEAVKSTDSKINLYYEMKADELDLNLQKMGKTLKEIQKHVKKFKRVAIVTDYKWMQKAASTLGFLIFARVKTFKTSDAEKAKVFVGLES